MRSLSEIQFWCVVAGFALTPMITFGITGGIGWFLRRTLLPRPEVAPQLGREPVPQEPTGASG